MTTITQTTKNNWIDLHSHILYGIDDGSKTIEQSKKELDLAFKIGMKAIVCTPHMCYGHHFKINKVIEKYNILKEYANDLGIKLYLGNEILYNSETVIRLRNKKIIPINGTRYVLLEFKRTENKSFEEIISNIEDIMDEGYKVILAHPEFNIYYRKIEYVKRLKQEGVLLQMDASSVFRKNKKAYKFSKKLLKMGLIDIVSSDTHCTKKRSIMIYKKAYHKIVKKYGLNYAEQLFYKNPLMILKNISF